MPLADIRAQIKAIIQAADSVSQVHDYERWTNDPNSLQALFTPPSGPAQFRAWVFKPYGIHEFARTNRETLVVYVFLVRFVLSVKDADATERSAADMIETVRAEFRKLSRLTLNGTCETIDTQEGPMAGRAGLQLTKLDFIKLGGVLCHYAELQLAAQELLARPA